MSPERVHDRSQLRFAGQLVSSSAEVNHSTQLYLINPAKLEEGVECSAPHCRSEDKSPISMQYEIDHFKQVWIYLYCLHCSPDLNR